MKALIIIALIICLPLAIYLQGQAYRNVHGHATIGRDVENLIQSFKEWRRRRELKRKYKYLNRRK